MTITSLPVHKVSSGSGEDAGFQAALTTACVVRLAETGWIRVTGEDRVRWLNGMVTNSIQGLGAGQGCFNFLLNAQGRIQGTAMAFAADEAILLETDRAQVAPMMAMLDRFIIMDDVELADVSNDWAGLLVTGPAAEELLRTEGLLPGALGGGAAVQSADVDWRGARVRVQAMPGKVVARYEVWAAAEVVSQLGEALVAAGAVEGDTASVELLRMLEGTPRFGLDIREKELAQETGQAEALHFSKGCYLGQEIVERIRSRGSVHRTFAGFALDGVVPVVGTTLVAGGKTVGEMTSVGMIPAVEGCVPAMTMALGYVRREAVETNQEIGYEGGVARVLPLPVAIGSTD